MAADIACIAGKEIHRLWETGGVPGERIGPLDTPFGPSAEIFRVDDGEGFYLLPRHGTGLDKVAPRRINNRANLYALKDLGVRCILAWGPGGAITHNIAVGDMVILSDVVDLTYLRDKTFFEDSALGFLRQFPVFCPKLRRTIAEVLDSMKLVYDPRGTAAVCEGPRLETPAEVRRLATIGAAVVTHTFAPEVFLARELQMCYAAICYVVDYAETGSRHRPFVPGNLFGGLSQKSDDERLTGVVGSMSRIIRNVAAELEQTDAACECHQGMARNIRKYDLSDDWHEWFSG